MKRKLKKLKRVNKIARLLYFILIIIFGISYLFFAKSVIALTGIETIWRYLILLFFIIYFIFYINVNYHKLIHSRYTFFYFNSLLTVLFIILFFSGSVFINFLYGKINNINEKNKIVYTSYLISLNDTELKSDSIIGMIEDENDIEGFILAKELMKENNLSQKINKYVTYTELLNDLYEKKIDAGFVSNNYVTLFNSDEAFTNIGTETKVVYKFSKKMKNSDSTLTTDKKLKDPFSVLIMGVDSASDGLNANAAFNGDTLMLATFNPHNLTTTLFSIPRDTLVPIACKNNRIAKINSSAAYGTSCVIDTIENLTGIDIDYYVKINFKGVVDLVEAMKGIDVEVEKPNYEYNHGHYCKGIICEQDSLRRWGEHTIYINPGKQHLNGEQALAYARCRGLYAASDLARNRHQQDIIMAMAKSLMKIDSYSEFKNIIDAVTNNLSTNMTTNQILSSYNIFKSILDNYFTENELIDIQKAYLEIYDLKKTYLLNATRATDALGYYKDSLKAIIKTMKVNLDLEKPELITSFAYSLNEDFSTKPIGKNLKKETSYLTIPSFIGKSKEEVEKYCQEKQIAYKFTYVDAMSEFYNNDVEIDKIGYQSYLAGSLINNITTINIYINGI